jgi:hypothetical protein
MTRVPILSAGWITWDRIDDEAGRMTPQGSGSPGRGAEGHRAQLPLGTGLAPISKPLIIYQRLRSPRLGAQPSRLAASRAPPARRSYVGARLVPRAFGRVSPDPAALVGMLSAERSLETHPGARDWKSYAQQGLFWNRPGTVTPSPIATSGGEHLGGHRLSTDRRNWACCSPISDSEVPDSVATQAAQALADVSQACFRISVQLCPLRAIRGSTRHRGRKAKR